MLHGCDPAFPAPQLERPELVDHQQITGHGAAQHAHPPGQSASVKAPGSRSPGRPPHCSTRPGNGAQRCPSRARQCLTFTPSTRRGSERMPRTSRPCLRAAVDQAQAQGRLAAAGWATQDDNVASSPTLALAQTLDPPEDIAHLNRDAGVRQQKRIAGPPRGESRRCARNTAHHQSSSPFQTRGGKGVSPLTHGCRRRRRTP